MWNKDDRNGHNVHNDDDDGDDVVWQHYSLPLPSSMCNTTTTEQTISLLWQLNINNNCGLLRTWECNALGAIESR